MTLLSKTLLEGMRKSTKALIESGPTSISLVRKGAPVRTPEGGVTRQGASFVLPARDRYFGRVTLDTRMDVRAQGQQIFGDYVLIGLRDDDIRQDDTFTFNNRKFRVLWIEPDNSYQVKAFVGIDSNIILVANLDGGTATSVFDTTIDGGIASSSSFESFYNGGGA